LKAGIFKENVLVELLTSYEQIKSQELAPPDFKEELGQYLDDSTTKKDDGRYLNTVLKQN
jgi:hypothetical protein